MSYRGPGAGRQRRSAGGCLAIRELLKDQQLVPDPAGQDSGSKRVDRWQGTTLQSFGRVRPRAASNPPRPCGEGGYPSLVVHLLRPTCRHSSRFISERRLTCPANSEASSRSFHAIESAASTSQPWQRRRLCQPTETWSAQFGQPPPAPRRANGSCLRLSARR